MDSCVSALAVLPRSLAPKKGTILLCSKTSTLIGFPVRDMTADCDAGFAPFTFGIILFVLYGLPNCVFFDKMRLSSVAS